MKKLYTSFSENPMRRNAVGGLGIVGRIILSWILDKWVVNMWAKLNWLRMNLRDDGLQNKKDIWFIIRWTIRIHRLLPLPELRSLLRLSESLWQWLVHYTTIGHCLLSDVRLIQYLVWCFGSWLYFQLQVIIMLTSIYYWFYFSDKCQPRCSWVYNIRLALKRFRVRYQI
jgi:hypothetical protein